MLVVISHQLNHFLFTPDVITTWCLQICTCMFKAVTLDFITGTWLLSDIEHDVLLQSHKVSVPVSVGSLTGDDLVAISWLGRCFIIFARLITLGRNKFPVDLWTFYGRFNIIKYSLFWNSRKVPVFESKVGPIIRVRIVCNLFGVKASHDSHAVVLA